MTDRHPPNQSLHLFGGSSALTDLVPRRHLFRAAAGAAAFALAGVVTAAGAPDSDSTQRKMTQKEAEYQDEPKGGIMMCLTCTLFIAPAGCKVVEGDVAATGWCKAFDMAD